MEQPRYHEIIRPIKEFVAQRLGRASVGEAEPFKRSQIVDEGKTAEQARPVQLVIEGMQQNRWDSLGNYMDLEDDGQTT